MNKTVTILIILILAVVGFVVFSGDSVNQDGNTESPVSVNPISHGSVVLEWDDTVIYADPVGEEGTYEDQPDPDIILITHRHGDHLDSDTLSRVITEETNLIVSKTVFDQLPDNLSDGAVVMANGQAINRKGINIRAIPMYNIPESDDANHIKGEGNGYVLEKNDYRTYIAGDTSGIPEMRSLENIDLAFVPMNLPYTMDVEEAADAVLEFAPATVYPYHYRGTDGLSDVDRFKQLVEEGSDNIEVILGDWYPNQ